MTSHAFAQCQVWSRQEDWFMVTMMLNCRGRNSNSTLCASDVLECNLGSHWQDLSSPSPLGGKQLHNKKMNTNREQTIALIKWNTNQQVSTSISCLNRVASIICMTQQKTLIPPYALDVLLGTADACVNFISFVTFTRGVRINVIDSRFFNILSMTWCRTKSSLDAVAVTAYETRKRCIASPRHDNKSIVVHHPVSRGQSVSDWKSVPGQCILCKRTSIWMFSVSGDCQR